MDELLLVADADGYFRRWYPVVLAAHRCSSADASIVAEVAANPIELKPHVLAIDFNSIWDQPDGLIADLRNEVCRAGVPPVFLNGCDLQKSLAALLSPPVVRYFRRPFPVAETLAALRACGKASWHPIEE
jgi:hypothetical protein